MKLHVRFPIALIFFLVITKTCGNPFQNFFQHQQNHPIDVQTYNSNDTVEIVAGFAVPVEWLAPQEDESDPRSTWRRIRRMVRRIRNLPQRLFSQVLMALAIPGAIGGVISGTLVSGVLGSIGGGAVGGARNVDRTLLVSKKRYNKKKHLLPLYRLMDFRVPDRRYRKKNVHFKGKLI